MMIEDFYYIDWEKIKKDLESKNNKKIYVELPEGLKIYMDEIREKLKDYEIIFSGENIYGACDVHLMDNYITLHFAHSRIPNINYGENIIFVEIKSKVDPEFYYKKILSLPCKSFGLLASIQYIHLLEKLKDYLEKNGFSARIGKGDDRLFYPGQVLGCNFSSAKSIMENVDCFIVISDGEFHARGVSVSTQKDTYAFDPLTGEIKKIDYDKLIKIRYGQIELARNAKKFALIVSTKIGQLRLKYARKLLEKLREKGMDGEIVIMDNVTLEKLENLNFDAFVNFACPRIVLDNEILLKKPFLTPVELEMLLENRPYYPYFMDEIIKTDDKI